MSGAGLVAFGGASVYGYATGGGGSTRVRVSLDGWDRVGLAEGQLVRAGPPGSADRTLLATGVRRDPPLVCLEMRDLGGATKAG